MTLMVSVLAAAASAPATQLGAWCVTLQRTTLLLESIYNTSMSVRLGLLSPDHHAMLLLLPPQLPSRGNREGNSGASPGQQRRLAGTSRCFCGRQGWEWQSVHICKAVYACCTAQHMLNALYVGQLCNQEPTGAHGCIQWERPQCSPNKHPPCSLLHVIASLSPTCRCNLIIHHC